MIHIKTYKTMLQMKIESILSKIIHFRRSHNFLHNDRQKVGVGPIESSDSWFLSVQLPSSEDHYEDSCEICENQISQPKSMKS